MDVVTYADRGQGQDGFLSRAPKAVTTGVVGKANLHLVDWNGNLQVTAVTARDMA